MSPMRSGVRKILSASNRRQMVRPPPKQKNDKDIFRGIMNVVLFVGSCMIVYGTTRSRRETRKLLEKINAERY